ncbi:MAG: hypothetical protein MUO72_16185 [Bacteroidales bacterium]|nr:hypothetical protein [Bacteroidales bacterium]
MKTLKILAVNLRYDQKEDQMKATSKFISLFFVIFLVFPPIITAGQEQANPKILRGTIVSINQPQGDIFMKTDSGDTIKITNVYHYIDQISGDLKIYMSGTDFTVRLKNFSDFKVRDRIEISYQPGHTELDSFKKISQQSTATKKLPPKS